MPAAEEAAPLDQTMQGLLSLVNLMRKGAPDAAGNAPKLIFTGSGLEIRFAGASAGDPAETPESEESNGRLDRIERTLKLLSARLSKLDSSLSQSILELESQLGAQSEIVESLRATVQQNEEMIETLADSLNIVDDLGHSDLGPELVLSPATIAS
jgi:uncharacterized coiled-coil protein SlyX